MSGRNIWIVSGLLTFLVSVPASAIVIDNFSTTQGPLDRTAPGHTGIPISSVAVGGGILGGERDIEVNLISTTPAGNGISVVVASFNHSQDGGIRGTSFTSWDGVDGNGSSGAVAHTGLSSTDLTVGGTHSALLIEILSADLMSTIVFEVFTNAANSSKYTLNLTGGAFNDVHVIPYASFVTNLGAGANFTNVGAITMLVDGSTVPALDVVIARIETTPQLTASKTDALFVDVDLDGNVDVGDRIKYTITITNPDDDGNLAAPGVIFTDSPDPSTSLFVGSVMTSQGSVTIGNTLGDTTVSVNVGSIADGASVTIMFEVTVTAEDPLVCNQGFAGTIPTDDPDTPATLDPTCTVVTFCGDGIVNDATEECDDGNLNDNDDCSNNCTMGCGNDIVNTGESCDGTAEAPGVDCTLPCRATGSMDECTCCGDNILQGPSGETCDGLVFQGGAPVSHGACRSNCTFCGDGLVNGGEECDDGNANDNDDCSNNCTMGCGNDIVNTGESCDGTAEAPGVDCTLPCRDMGSMDECTCCGDNILQGPSGETCDGSVFQGGAPVSHGACRSDCTFCGDGLINGGEQCDDGNAVDSDNCRNDCTNARCGDGVVDTQPPGVEECDDGNLNDNDNCRNDCTNARCGDGVVDLQPPNVEQCDDGNLIDNDGCTNACTLPRCGDGIVQMGEQCDDGNAVDNDACTNACTTPRCGDGIVQMGEQCDDGNAVDNDACTNACTTPRCGDGIVQMGEQCDDGNAVNNDACTNACTTPRCGDGIVQAGEQCDDGNNTNGDGCQANCLNPRCGDGIVDPGEACDDGNLINNDGCTNTCRLPTCGDGIVQAPEQCDDGNAVNNDGCTNVCTTPRCGDGILQVGEQCDDGNVVNDDACTNACDLPRCGDNIQQAGEECDGSDRDQCQAGVLCRPDCTCAPEPGDDIPTVSEWGLLVLALLLGTMAKLQFGRPLRSAVD